MTTQTPVPRTPRASHGPMYPELFLEALAPMLRPLDGLPVVMVAALSTLGSPDGSPWPPFQLAVVLSTPIDVEIAAERLGFICDLDRHGITTSAAGRLNGMQLVVFSNWSQDEGMRW